MLLIIISSFVLIQLIIPVPLVLIGYDQTEFRMFRGEPIALWTLVFGFISFVFVQIFGLMLTGELQTDSILTLQAHFFLAYFGWIGLTILGAQLQFFRAITGMRKYGPQPLRYFYHLFLLSGLVLMIYGSWFAESNFVTFGLFLYLLGLLIHSYWIINASTSKYFKFPLDYFFVSNIFLIISVLILFISNVADEYFLINLSQIRHMLSIGWISLTLQGALVRILPMFVGQNIDRKSRVYLREHFVYSSITSTLLILSFISELDWLIAITGMFWGISWVWVFFILIKSIDKPNLQYRQTLLFFVPGMIWFLIGIILGVRLVIVSEISDINYRLLHIHVTLLLGISLIMLGAFHRITTFQIYTLLYTGRRSESVTLKSMLRVKWLAVSALSFNISVVLMVIGFLDNDYTQIGFGGTLIIISTLIYSYTIFSNLVHYLREKHLAIPFWLKPTET